MQRLFLSFLCIIFFSPISEAKLLTSLSIKNKMTTFNTILPLAGSGNNIEYVKINGIQVNVLNNSFSCKLILHPGKNLVNIEVWGKHQQYESYSRRILKLVAFQDLTKPQPHWAKAQIITLATLGIIEAYPDNMFYVNNNLTKGELATWICRARGLSGTPTKDDVFPDVPKEHWRAPFIKEVTDRGYMEAEPNGLFGIDLPVTRAQAAYASLKAEGKNFEKEIVSVFYDIPKNHPLYSQIKYAKAEGLIKGVSWKKAIFQPERYIKRAEAAVLIARFGQAKWLGKWLYNFNAGFTKNVYCRVNIPPRIFWAEIIPKEFKLNQNDFITIAAHVEDLEGMENILSVKTGLAPLSGPKDAKMVFEKNLTNIFNGRYLLNFSATPEVSGEFKIPIIATDKIGSQDILYIPISVKK